MARLIHRDDGEVWLPDEALELLRRHVPEYLWGDPGDSVLTDVVSVGKARGVDAAVLVFAYEDRQYFSHRREIHFDDDVVYNKWRVAGRSFATLREAVAYITGRL